MKLHIILSLTSFSIYKTNAVVKPHQRDLDNILLVFRIFSWFFGVKTIDFHVIFGWIILVCSRCLYHNRNHLVALLASSFSFLSLSSLECVVNRGMIELFPQMLLSQRYKNAKIFNYNLISEFISIIIFSLK